MKDNKKGLTRRDFLKGSAVSVAGIAVAASLTGCSTDNEQELVITKENYEDVKWGFEQAPDPITRFKEEISTEIVVVGSGMSGLTTACSAAENGAEVILISASSAPISRGGSNSATNSRIMKQHNVKPVDPDTFFNREYLSASYQVDQKKWTKFYNHSEEAMEWLIDKLEAEGIGITLERDNSDAMGPVFAHGFIAPNATGSMVASGQQSAVETMAKYCERAGVKIIYNMIGVQLIREDNNTGRVSGIVAKNEAGDYIKYSASKGIVLATGDFSANKEMVAKYAPHMIPLVGMDELEDDYDRGFNLSGIFKGDGQKMGLWIGAAWQKAYPNAPMMQGSWGGGHEPLGFHYGLVVNTFAERFAREDVSAPYSSNHLLSQPQRKSYGIWTENFAQQLIDNGHQWHSFGQTIDDPAHSAADMIVLWENGVAEGSYVKADTVAQLAEKLELPEAVLEQTLVQYNEMCQNKIDTDFYKDPDFLIEVDMAGPFYAATNTPTFMTVMGGLRTNAAMQVCDAEDKAIPGLFNVGIMVGDMYANTYNFVIPGHCYGGNCLTFGYLLGRDLAQDVFEA